MTEYIILSVHKPKFALNVSIPVRGSTRTVTRNDTRIARNGDTRIARNDDTRIAHRFVTITPQKLAVSKKTFRLLVEAAND